MGENCELLGGRSYYEKSFSRLYIDSPGASSSSGWRLLHRSTTQATGKRTRVESNPHYRRHASVKTRKVVDSLFELGLSETESLRPRIEFHMLSEPTPAGQGGRLPNPHSHLFQVEFALVDIDPARSLVLS